MAQLAAGVDVGGHSVKIVIGRVRMRRVEVLERHEVVIPRQEDGRPREEGVRRALAELMSRVKNRPGLVFSALSADEVLIRTVQVPRAASRKSDAVIRMQIEDDLPIDLDEAVVDHILRPEPGSDTLQALVAVARQDTVREYLQLLDEFKLDPAELGAGAAVYTDLARVMPKLADAEPELVVDIGSSRTDMLIIEGGEAASMRTLLVGGADMTRAIASHYRTTFDKAEEYKVLSSWGTLAPVLGPMLDRLVQPIRQSMSKHLARTGRKVVKVFTCGGTSLMPGLSEALAQELGVPVAALESENPDAAGKEQRDGPFLRAAALAHRALSNTVEQRFDLRKGPFVYKGQARATRRRWVRLVIAGLVIVLGWSFYSLARISSLKARQAAQRDRLAELSEQYLGESVTDFDRAEKLMQSAKPVKSPMPKADAFQFVSEMSRIIPEEIIHDVEELEIKPGKVQIRGIVDTIAARDEIISKLEEYQECVVDISKGKTTQSPKDNRQKYTLDLETECP